MPLNRFNSRYFLVCFRAKLVAIIIPPYLALGNRAGHRIARCWFKYHRKYQFLRYSTFFWRTRFSVKVRKHHSIMPVRILEGPCLNVVCSTNATRWTNRDPELGLMNNGTMIRSVASIEYHRIASYWQCFPESARCQDHLKRWKMTAAKSNGKPPRGIANWSVRSSLALCATGGHTHHWLRQEHPYRSNKRPFQTCQASPNEH